MQYRPEIDGLRALAVTPVIFFHAGFASFSGGFVGVDVFFVISGYLITTILADEIAEDRFSIWRFYERRARRILPALFLVVLVSLPFAWFWLMPTAFETYVNSNAYVATFTSNIFFWSQTGYFQTAAELQPMLHTWSLAVEEQFYILFPPLLLFIWRFGAQKVLFGLLLASLIFTEWLLRVDASAAFFLLPTRAWELLIGSMAALHLRQRTGPMVSAGFDDVLTALGVGLILYGVWAFDGNTRFPGVNALSPTIGTALVVLFAQPGGITQRILALKPLVFIGLISYGAYLWHQPVFALFQSRFGSIAFETYALPLIALSFGLAYAGYRLVEQPFRHGVTVKTLKWSMIGAVVTSIAIGTVMLRLVERDPNNSPSYRWAVAHAEPELLDYVEGRHSFLPCAEDPEIAGVESCSIGDPNAPQTLVLWGDSLSQALLSGMDEAARKRGIGVRAFGIAGCPPVLGLANALYDECDGTSHEKILSKIEAMEGAQQVVITGYLSSAMSAGNVAIDGRSTSFEAVSDKFAETKTRLETSNKSMVLLEEGPVYEESVTNYLLQNMRHGHPEPLTLDREEYEASIANARALVDLPDTYIQTADFFCSETDCPSVDQDGKLVIFDHNHVTPLYSKKLAEYLLTELGL